MLDSSKIRTRKLYYEDAYKTEFSALVVSADAGDVVLDRTAFFPEEGGQSSDIGELGGFRVADVKIKDGEIHHLQTQEWSENCELKTLPNTKTTAYLQD